jgi:hypothetical protein
MVEKETNCFPIGFQDKTRYQDSGISEAEEQTLYCGRLDSGPDSTPEFHVLAHGHVVGRGED